MSYTKERDEFLRIIQEEGLPYATAAKLLRYSQTLHRLAVAQCNGDWPYNGDRDRPLPQTAEERARWDKRYVVCPRCQASGIRVSSMRTADDKTKVCPDCRTTELVHAALPEGFKAILAGDPRGCVFKLQVPSGRTNDWGKEGICVPVRER